MNRVIREEECRAITGLSRTTRWEMERAGTFPPRRRLSPNTVGWLLSDIRRWLHNRVAGVGRVPVRALAIRVTVPVVGRRRTPKASRRRRQR